MEGAGQASTGPRAVPRPSQVQGEVSWADSLARRHLVPPRHFAPRPAGPGPRRFLLRLRWFPSEGSWAALGWTLTRGPGLTVRVRCPSA